LLLCKFGLDQTSYTFTLAATNSVMSRMKSLRRRMPELIGTLRAILDRYDRYSRYLNFPGEWGERVFRGWVAFEIVHTHLRWPTANIIFGGLKPSNSMSPLPHAPSFARDSAVMRNPAFLGPRIVLRTFRMLPADCPISHASRSPAT